MLNKLRDVFKSLNMRLLVIFILVGILPILILQFSLLTVYEKRSVDVKTIEILNQAKILANTIVSEDFIHNTENAVIQAELTQFTTIYDGRVLLVDTNYEIVLDTYNLDTYKTIISEEVMKSFQGQDVNNYDSENRYIELSIPLTTQGETSEIIGVMLVSVSTDSDVLNYQVLSQNATIISVALSLLIVVFALVLSFRLTAPLRKMAESIQRLHNGFDDEKMEFHGYTELHVVADKINDMTASMKVLNDSRQEFVSNVSHELKTPLASMKVLADSLNGQENVPIELYKEFMSDIGEEIDRENKIISDLLSLVKMDKTAADLNISSVNINELLELILKRLKPLAEKQNVDLVLESFRPVVAEIDEVKFTLAITNLVENGIKYNKPEGGWVHVSLNADYQFFYVKVEDSGIGIPEDSQEHIYERFYRVDKSHSREIGGTGLGLAITRSAILMHRGAIRVHSADGEGTTFTVRIPINYIA